MEEEILSMKKIIQNKKVLRSDKKAFISKIELDLIKYRSEYKTIVNELLKHYHELLKVGRDTR